MTAHRQTILSLSFIAILVSRFGDKNVAAPWDKDAAIGRAVTFLLDRQQEDGAWKSDHYAVLRQGDALTSFILSVLVGFGPDLVPRERLDRGFAFLRSRVNADGALGLADPDLLEYPVYATAHAVLAFARRGDESDRPLLGRMTRWLKAQQCSETRGFDPSHVAYGAFGFGAQDQAPGDPGHVDLAHTRRVLDALRAANEADPETFRRASRFLALCQKQVSEAARQPLLDDLADAPPRAPDGGFYFSPVVHRANKGRIEAGTDGYRAVFRSYATATAEGLLALHALGPQDKRHRAARSWLEHHAALHRPDGIPADFPEPWDDALFYYHLAVRAEVDALPGSLRTAAAAILAMLLPLQSKDGSFANSRSSLMKEDDPLLATSLALQALGSGSKDR